MHLGTDSKIIGGIALATFLIVVGGIFFFNRPAPSNTTSGLKVDNSILIRSDSNQIATTSAKAVLVEFGDFQCPACGSYFPVIKKLLTDFKNDVNFVFRNFPLSQHKNAVPAAISAEAAGKQGKYWEMFDLIYANQDKWSDSKKAQEIFDGYANELKLNMDQFKKDLQDQSLKDKLDRDTQDGNTLGVNSTPTFFLNGEKLQNPGSFDDFATLIKAAIIKSPITQAPSEAYHTHANIKVIIKDKPLDFSLSKYQSPDDKELDKNIHFHDGVGDLIHIHKKGETLGDLFKSLKISFNSNCFTIDTGEKFCGGKSESLKFFINGKANDQFEKYEPQDLDRILISYGSESDQAVKQQVDSVADTACIYSEKCPERGKPPTEKCVGGLGTNCK